MKYELTCINCPMGCTISAQYDGVEVSDIEGYTCKRGMEYAKTEITAPVRTVTALAQVYGTSEPVSVKTAMPVDKNRVQDVVNEIKKTVNIRPIHIGDVIVYDVCGTGVNVIATEEFI